MSTSKSNFWSSPLTKSRITSDDVKMPEMLLGYFIGPFGALLSSGIFTSILQNYFTDVLKLDLGFLTTLQLVSTVLIVAQRVSTIMHAEQIVVLDEGRVAGIGTHKQLLETCETYREIAQSQLSKEELA